MGILLDIFSLYCFQNQSGSCHHYLLLRVEQSAFSNADEGEYDHVVEAADKKRRVLIEQYQAETLADECGPHLVILVGELQEYPIGDELLEEHGGFYVDLWIAETQFGHPWIVLGTAENEEAFWRSLQDQDLSHLRAIRPARKQQAFFLTETAYKSRNG